MSEAVWAASGIEQQPPDVVYCPDCDRWIEAALFVEHRELAHPPSARVVHGAGGIASREQVGTPGGDR